jgi:hypothetical protein
LMRVTAVNRVCTAAVYYHLISGVGIRRRRNGADKSSGVDATVTYITHVCFHRKQFPIGSQSPIKQCDKDTNIERNEKLSVVICNRI